MRRTSLLAELELHYIYALQLKTGRIGRGTPYFSAINEYIDTFYFKFDVMSDLRKFIRLIDDPVDCQELFSRFSLRIDQAMQVLKENNDTRE